MQPGNRCERLQQNEHPAGAKALAPWHPGPDTWESSNKKSLLSGARGSTVHVLVREFDQRRPLARRHQTEVCSEAVRGSSIRYLDTSAFEALCTAQ